MKIAVFLKRGGGKRLFVEAACETFLASIVISVCRPRRYTALFGRSREETATAALDASRREQVLRVKTAIVRCRRLAWARKCLVASVAAKRMLDRRQIPATLYMGVAKDEKGELIAHAWLRSGDVWVSGGRYRRKFTVVGAFS